MATTRHLHRNLTAAKNIIPKPTHHGKKEATPNKGASQGASPNKNAEIWRGSSKSKLIYTDAPKGTQKTTASISESNQFRTKFFPPLFIFTTVGVIRIRRSRSFLSLFNPRWMKLTTFQQHTSRDFLICFGWFFSSGWRQCAVPGVVIKNLFLSASSLLAPAMLEVLISAPIIYLSVCLSVCLCLCLSVCISACTHKQ